MCEKLKHNAVSYFTFGRNQIETCPSRTSIWHNRIANCPSRDSNP